MFLVAEDLLCKLCVGCKYLTGYLAKKKKTNYDNLRVCLYERGMNFATIRFPLILRY